MRRLLAFRDQEHTSFFFGAIFLLIALASFAFPIAYRDLIPFAFVLIPMFPQDIPERKPWLARRRLQLLFVAMVVTLMARAYMLATTGA